MRRSVRGLHDIESAVLRGHHLAELRKDELGHRNKILLALQHARELRQVGLEPILLGVLLGRVLEVANHLVDVVLQGRHFALSLDRDRPAQIPLGDGGGNLSDGPHLRGQVGGELVDVIRQVAPGSRGAGHARLAA